MASVPVPARVPMSVLLLVLVPSCLLAATSPHDLDGAYRVASKADANSAAAQPGERDCVPRFVAGVGLASTAHLFRGRDVLAIVHEANHTLRRIHLDGHHPADLRPSTFGHSIGWWEGDTLVVETVGLKSGRTVVERMRKVNGDRALEVIVNGRATLAERLPARRYAEDNCELRDAPAVNATAARPETATRVLEPAVASTVAAATAVRAAPLRAFDGVWRIAQPVRSLRTVDGDSPPLRLDARKQYAERLQLYKAGKAAAFNGSDACVPPGEPRTAHGGQPFEIVQGAKAMLFAYQWNRMLRVAYLQEPDSGQQAAAYYGHWSGYSDGAALVLEGGGFRGDTMLDAAGLPHSESMHLTQRLSLVRDGEELEIRTTVDDPKIYARSWSTVQRYRRVKDGVVGEHVCQPVTNMQVSKE